MLLLTTALLQVLSRAPLRPETTLLNLDAPQALEAIFATDRPLQPQKWTTIFVRHTATPGGNGFHDADGQGEQAGDHFVIGNGDGAGDGEIQMSARWVNQLAAEPPGLQVDPGCVTIALVGDFNRTRPTPAQVRRVELLVTTLQTRLHIPAGGVYLSPGTASAAGIGQYFPVGAFREHLLR